MTANVNIDRILELTAQLEVEFGRTKITLKKLLESGQGSIIELDGAAGEQLDILVNGCLIAKGEAVVVNDKIGIRITEIISQTERLTMIKKGK